MQDFDKIREQVIAEYKKIAFAPIDGEIKITDKLRALDAYWALISAEKPESETDETFRVKVEYV